MDLARGATAGLILLAVAACRGEPGAPAAPRDPDATAPSTDSGAPPDTANTPTMPTVPVFDTAGPPCVQTVPVDTGWLEDTAAPTEPCDVAPIERGVPGATAIASDLAMARIDGIERGVLGTGLVLLGDRDGDGFGEIAVSLQGTYGDLFQYNSIDGELWLFDGDQTGVLGRADARTVLVPPPDGLYGASCCQTQLVLRGDLTGDGAADLVVGGASWVNPTYVVPLPVPDGEHALDTVAVAEIEHWSQRATSGRSIGDYDGDGSNDLAFAGYAHTPRNVPGGVGIVRGPFNGPSRAKQSLDASLDVSDLDHPWLESHGSGTLSQALVHDVDGDGTQEVLVGGERFANYAPPASIEFDPFHDHGGLVLFTGGVLGDRTVEDARAVLYGTCFFRLSAESQAVVGDVTGDCLPDVATSGHQGQLDEPGAVLVQSNLHRVRGYVSAARAAGVIIVGEEPGDGLGDVGRIGDLDQDGHADLLVGARFAGENGAAYLFLGPLSGVVSAGDADLVIYGSGEDRYFGSRIAGGRDLDGDGVGDVAIGAYGSEWNGELSGSVYLFSGADLLALVP